MEKKQYISMLVQSLQKKNRLLDEIIEINRRQRDILDNPNADPDDFDKTVEEKSDRIEELDCLDDGFQEVFRGVKEELEQHKASYAAEITQMQQLIKDLTDKSASIQVQESRNKKLMEQKFTSVKKQAREVRKSQKVVNQYYKNMMKTNYIEPQFTDSKK